MLEIQKTLEKWSRNDLRYGLRRGRKQMMDFGLLNGKPRPTVIQRSDRIRVINFEDRRYPRINIHLPIEYYRTKPSITHTGNISEGGLLIHFPDKMDPSQYLRLKLFFSLGSELNILKALAEVVWMDNHLSEDRENCPCGVKFVDISPEDEIKLRNLLASLSYPLEDES